MHMSIVSDCKDCDAHCCRHVATHIGKPKSKRDYDHIRWYLLHENVWVSIDHNGDWLLEFRTPCKNIRDNQCADYQNRPVICKEYPATDELCERQSDEKSYRYLFTSVSDFEEFLLMNNKCIPWKKTNNRFMSNLKQKKK